MSSSSNSRVQCSTNPYNTVLFMLPDKIIYWIVFHFSQSTRATRHEIYEFLCFAENIIEILNWSSAEKHISFVSNGFMPSVYVQMKNILCINVTWSLLCWRFVLFPFHWVQIFCYLPVAEDRRWLVWWPFFRPFLFISIACSLFPCIKSKTLLVW